MRITDAQLQEIKTLDAARTAGEWSWEAFTFSGLNGWETEYHLRPAELSSHWQDEDTAFVAACSWAVPLLIAEVEALREENARLRTAESSGSTLREMAEKTDIENAG